VSHLQALASGFIDKREEGPIGNTMCPGQDTAFWRPSDIFEVPCSQCGYELEFFKDDVSRRCTRCGGQEPNPKLILGCAQWCEHAKECLGWATYDSKEVLIAKGGALPLLPGGPPHRGHAEDH